MQLFLSYHHAFFRVAVLLLLLTAPVNRLRAQVTDTVIEEVQEPPGESYTDEEQSTDFFIERNGRSGMDSVQLRHLPDSLVKTLKDDDAFHYNRPADKKEAAARPQSGQGGRSAPYTYRRSIWESGVVKTIFLVIIIGGFITLLVILLSNGGLFRRKTRGIAQDSEETVDTEDIFAINYQREIDKAAAAGNYRLAIRLMFLRSLKTMAEKNIIRYRVDSTNLDYLGQLSHGPWYNDFFRIARNYEYSWYGQFDVQEESYSIIRNDFNQFDQKLR